MIGAGDFDVGAFFRQLGIECGDRLFRFRRGHIRLCLRILRHMRRVQWRGLLPGQTVFLTGAVGDSGRGDGRRIGLGFRLGLRLGSRLRLVLGLLRLGRLRRRRGSGRTVELEVGFGEHVAGFLAHHRQQPVADPLQLVELLAIDLVGRRLAQRVHLAEERVHLAVELIHLLVLERGGASLNLLLAEAVFLAQRA